MPRQVILSALEREALLTVAANRDDLIRWYTFSEAELALIRQRRSDATRKPMMESGGHETVARGSNKTDSTK